MSLDDIFYRQNIHAFVCLMETQSPLFSEHREALETMAQSFGEDVREISDAIKVWCMARPEIFEAHVILLEDLCDKSNPETCRGPGGVSSYPLPPAKKLREEIVNAIRVNAPRRKKAAKDKDGEKAEK